jgi:hypothetical protein
MVIGEVNRLLGLAVGVGQQQGGGPGVTGAGAVPEHLDGLESLLAGPCLVQEADEFLFVCLRLSARVRVRDAFPARRGRHISPF